MTLVVGTPTTGGFWSTSGSFNHTCSAGQSLYLGVITDAAVTATATYNTDAMTAVGTHSANYRVTAFRLLAPDTGSAYSVAISLSGDSACACVAFGISGVDSGDPDDTPVTADDTTGYPDTTVSSATGDMVFQFVGVGSAALPATPGTDETEVADFVQDYLGIACYRQDGAASVQINPSLSNTFYSWTALAFNVNAAAGGYEDHDTSPWDPLLHDPQPGRLGVYRIARGRVG